MTEDVSKSKLFLARLVVVLMVAFVVVGLALYGFSAEVRMRIWQNLLERAGERLADDRDRHPVHHRR